VKRASKPNKKITTASQLLPVHGLLSNVFGKCLGRGGGGGREVNKSPSCPKYTKTVLKNRWFPKLIDLKSLKTLFFFYTQNYLIRQPRCF
jgi:hypothetical protein